MCATVRYLLVLLLLLTQAVWAAPVMAAPLHQENLPLGNKEPTKGTPQDETVTGPEPIIVDRCVNFTPFDAAAVLQEPVNITLPVTSRS